MACSVCHSKKHNLQKCLFLNKYPANLTSEEWPALKNSLGRSRLVAVIAALEKNKNIGLTVTQIEDLTYGKTVQVMSYINRMFHHADLRFRIVGRIDNKEWVYQIHRILL